MQNGTEMQRVRYHGWWVVFCAFTIALYGWGFGFYGLSLYLVALRKIHGWSPALISTGVTFYYVLGAFAVMQVGDVGQRVRVVQALRQRRSNAKVVAVLEQRAVDELGHSLRPFVITESRIEAVGTRADSNGDDAGVLRCLRSGAPGKDHQ